MTERREDCPCPKTECERHGLCEECKAHHHGKGSETYCEKIGEPRY